MIGMTKFIGPEYLVASAFVYLTKERFITFDNIYKYSYEVQKYWSNSEDIDAILTGRVNEDDLENFKDYYTVNDEASIVVLNSDVSIRDLEMRFIFNMPLNISESFRIVAKNFISNL